MSVIPNLFFLASSRMIIIAIESFILIYFLKFNFGAYKGLFFVII